MTTERNQPVSAAQPAHAADAAYNELSSVSFITTSGTALGRSGMGSPMKVLKGTGASESALSIWAMAW